MLQRGRNHLSGDEKGFSLIELLVVILIVGILAAIALPAFLAERTKGQDASATSNVRNAVSQVESCFVDRQTYDGCAVTTPSTVLVRGTDSSFEVRSSSVSSNTFSIAKADGSTTRSCVVGPSGVPGGCVDHDPGPGVNW